MNKKGFTTIETSFGILLFLVVILAVANVVAIFYERNVISIKTEALAANSSINGGVLQSDMNNFLYELGEKGYDTSQIIITARRIVNGSESGSNVFLQSMNSTNYVKVTDENPQIHLRIIIPYKENTIFYKLFDNLDVMVFERRFVSRRV
ncbi:MAG: hypothetical protein GX289_00485 [Tissierellia bacterium]|nr:hypothetical protein [Tissierellia bacterium]